MEHFANATLWLTMLISFSFFFLLHSFRKNDRLWIHRNLTLCLLISEFVFIGGISQTHLPILCGVVAGLLHYFLLVAFAWMFLEGFQIYTVLMEPMDGHRSRLWWFCSLAYIAPAVIVSIAAIIDPYSFGTSSYCWLESQNYFIFSFVGPCVGVVFVSVPFELSLLKKLSRKNVLDIFKPLNNIRSHFLFAHCTPYVQKVRASLWPSKSLCKSLSKCLCSLYVHWNCITGWCNINITSRIGV